MSQEPLLIQRLKHFRQRALHIAEYMYFTEIQQNQGTVAVHTQAEWRKLVRKIELHMMRDEEPSLMRYIWDDFTPLGIFFDETLTNVDVTNVYTPPQN